MDKLSKLLDETLSLSASAFGDAKVRDNVQKALQLAKSLECKSKGILTKFRLDGQVALVTGGGQGIGRAFAHALGEAGCKVAVADVVLERAQIVAKELESKGIPSVAIQADVSVKKEAEGMVEKVVSHFGDLHIACNNAGVVFLSDSEKTSEEEWHKTMGVNLNGVFFCCQAEAKHFLNKGYGRIINTASISASIVNHPQKQVAYNASKAAVVHLTKTLGTEWADRGITVNCISPGYVDTDLTKTEAFVPLRTLWIRDTPMQRLANVEDLTGAVIYLASPLASYTTGLDMIIDGGFTCW